MKFVADLHSHSKYSRAVSQKMVIPEIYKWAKIKGINLVGTGDFTHPFWFAQLKNDLKDEGNGFFTYKDGSNDVYFLLTTEVSSIYSQGGKGRRIHNLIFAPSFQSVEKINKKLLKYGSLSSDGRPILGISAKNLAEAVLEADKKALIVPAHIWTPWFSLYGSNSGFDSIDECFGEFAKNIFAIETGLSSDPAMNWRIKELDSRQILSFSDAHSAQKLGREATVIDMEASYDSFYDVVKTGEGVEFTIEFYPEEGKYHYTGHRNCNIRHSPDETKKSGTICSVCGKPLTIGVMHRVEELADRSEEEVGVLIKETSLANGSQVRSVSSNNLNRPFYFNLVPLSEIIAEALGVGVETLQVNREFELLTSHFGSELTVLLKAPVDEIAKVTQEKIAQGVEKVRKGDIFVDPGYDGVYGKVKIWQSETPQDQKTQEEQIALFG